MNLRLFRCLQIVLIVLAFSALMQPMASAEVFRIGSTACDSSSDRHSEELSSESIRKVLTELHTSISVLEIHCGNFEDKLRLRLNRPELSLHFSNVRFASGLELLDSNVRAFTIDGSTINDGNVRILRNHFYSFSILNTTINGHVQIGQNKISTGILVGNHTFFNDFNKENTTIDGELAIYQNHVAGFIELGGLVLSDERNMPFIFGNSAQSLVIKNLIVECQQCSDNFSLTRNVIQDHIHISETKISRPLEISGAPFDSIEIRGSTIKHLDLVGQKVRDVFIHDRTGTDKLLIDVINLQESSIDYLNILNAVSKEVNCVGCVIGNVASISGDIETVNLQDVNIGSVLEIGDAKLKDKIFKSEFGSLKLRNLVSPLVKLDHSIRGRTVDVEWTSSKISALDFSSHVSDPIELAKSIYASKPIETLGLLLAGYFDKNGLSDIARKIRFEVKSEQIWTANKAWLWKALAWAPGSLIGFGYYYENLVWLVFGLVAFGGIVYWRFPHPSKRGGKYFDGLAYSASQLIPGVALDERYEFSFEDACPRLYFYVVKIVGFVSIALIIADLSNAI